MKKGSNTKNALLVILFFIVVGIIVYFIISSNNVNWTEYIMNSDIKSIELTYCDDSGLDDNMSLSKTISINKNDLSKIFGEIEKGKLTKQYGGGFGSGCYFGLDIKYVKNNNEYEFNLAYNIIMGEITDKKLLSIIEKSEYETIKVPIEGYEYEYTEDDATYVLSYDTDIIDEYIK